MRRFIIVVVLAVFAATIGTIYVGSRTFDGVVVDRPYESGLAWDETQKRQARLGWHIVVEPAALKPGMNDILVRLTDRNGTPLDDADVDVTLSRPSTKDHDRTARAKPLGGGRYRVSLDAPLVGLWDVKTTVSRGTDRFSGVERVEAMEQTR